MKRIECFNKVILLASLLLLGSCSDFLDPEVTTARDVETSVSTAEDLDGLVLGAYDRMNATTYWGRDYLVFAEVRSDNSFSNGNSGRFTGPGQFFLNATDAYPTDTWTQIYAVISNANIVINTDVENNESDEVQHLKGEAYAIRAVAHMDLLRLFGQQNAGGDLGIPYITAYNDGNLYPERLPVNEVWSQIGADLIEADNRMTEAFNSDSPARITTHAVAALKSRYYLYQEDFDNVIAEAERVIDANIYALGEPADHINTWTGTGGNTSVFTLAFTSSDNLGNNSVNNIYQDFGYGDIEVTADLYNLYEVGDVRRSLYTYDADNNVYRMTGKYPNVTAGIRVIRYAEVILNYAEALLQDGQAGVALTVLNSIPTSRNASLYTTATLDNILAERRKELAMEGHRFFDLMRHRMAVPKVDPGQTFEDDILFGSTLLPFPIPQAELDANYNMEQNEDY